MSQKTKLSTCALITHNDKFLVLQRSASEDFLPLVWEFPGGSVEEHEEITDALFRELQEEIGVDLKGTPIKFLGISEEFTGLDKKDRYLQINYLIQLTYLPDITISCEHCDHCWVGKDDGKLDDFLKKIVQQIC
ncbi:MAG: NUDIX domain-containing protein [Alphaproteobacteria bacterium]|nr:NUDIX domain-containing protein [Alphaproteobacteria bacterium]